MFGKGKTLDSQRLLAYTDNVIKDLSKKQIELLRRLYIYRQKHGLSPSFRELIKLTRVSDVKSVYRIAEKLEKMGFLEKEKNKARSLKLSDKGMEVIGLSSFPIEFEPTSPIHSQASLAYNNKSLETSGTYSRDDLREIIKSEISAMGVHPDSTTLQGHDPKETMMEGFNSAVYQISHNEGFVTTFGWVMILIFLTWSSIAIVGNNLTALVYSVALSVIIKTILK